MSISAVLWTYLVTVLHVSSQQSKSGYEQVPTYWQELAFEELRTSLKDRQTGLARNLIMFLGDGMGISTVTGGRILAGQLLGKDGEEHKLSFDRFPHTGLSRTYSVDAQITDSAASATAYLSGVKTRNGLLGLSATAKRGICNTTSSAHVDSILHWSQRAGKSTGIVTTTRITHATPGAAYSHSGDRNWESDRTTPETERECEDIALQLITRNKDINVLLGGGRGYFYPADFPDPDPDPKFNTSKTSRLDGRNLVTEWILDKQQRGLRHAFVYDKSGFDQVDPTTTDYLLGLLSQNHLSYEVERNKTKEPSLTEMVEKAIRILSRNPNGFFLLVEGGRIDHGHHETKANKALNELVVMSEAVEMAQKLTSSSDTLIVVTADHSHVFNIAGYASRGNPIFGLSDYKGTLNLGTLDKMPYTTLLYATGPGYNSSRQNLTTVDTQDKDYVYQSAVPMNQETHGGEDVPIFATGPFSFLYSGVHEQNYIPLVMAYAACVGPFADRTRPCARDYGTTPTRLFPNFKIPNQAVSSKSSLHLYLLSLAVTLLKIYTFIHYV